MFKNLFIFIIGIPVFTFGQHSIKGSFIPAEDFKNAILYKVTPTESVYVTHTGIDEEGDFKFELDSTISQGMYKLVYALPQDEYNFDIIYNAKEDIELTYNPETGVKYQSSIENKLVTSYTTSMSLLSERIGDFYRQQSTDSLALALLFNAQEETQSNFEADATGTIALHFIKANKPYIPKGHEDLKTYIENLKIHFFDHVDFDNKVLQSSNFLIERILNYVFGLTNEEDEIATYKRNVDDICVAMTKADPVIKATLLEQLWQQMVDANLEDVANHISNKYLIKLAKLLNDQELVEGLTLFQNLSIGKKAPDFNLDIEKDGKTKTIPLSELQTAEQYVIVFWSSSCSHCLNEMPLLQSYANSKEEGNMQVIAVGLEDEPFNWRKETLKYPEFIHVLGFGKWNNSIGNSYNVRATPTYYVLDKDKIIVAKPYDFEDLKKFSGN